MSTYSANHKPLPEYDVDPADIPGLVEAAKQLPGVTTTLARNFGGWLLLVHAGDPEGGSSPNTRVRFRKMLRQLGAVPPPPTGDDAPPRMYESVKLAPLPMAA